MKAGTTGNNMVPAGRERLLARANAGTPNCAKISRSGLDEAKRLGFRSLRRKVRVKKSNGNRLATSARATRGTLGHVLCHGTAHLGLWDVRMSLVVATSATLVGVASPAFARTKVRIGSVEATRRLGVPTTTVRPGGIRSTSMGIRVHTTQTTTVRSVRCPKFVRNGMPPAVGRGQAARAPLRTRAPARPTAAQR